MLSQRLTHRKMYRAENAENAEQKKAGAEGALTDRLFFLSSAGLRVLSASSRRDGSAAAGGDGDISRVP